jgi:rhodanese-related sulfurtransferase
VVVDMRPPTAFNAGHIPGARSISLDDPVERLGDLPEDTAACRPGPRAVIRSRRDVDMATRTLLSALDLAPWGRL